MNRELLEIAEDGWSRLPPGPATEVLDDRRFHLRHMTFPAVQGGSAQRVRLDGDVASAIAAVRAWFAGHGRERFLWTVGPSTTPRDLERLLVAAGAEPWKDEPVWTGMVMTTPPPAVPGIEVRKVTRLEEAHAAVDVAAAAAGSSAEEVSAAHAHVDERWAKRDPKRAAEFLGRIDGAAVASATSWYGDGAVYLSGSGTIPAARGRGAYRALVRARWEDAVARGTPALVVQAGSMSRPILERVGFDSVCEVHALVDRSAPP